MSNYYTPQHQNDDDDFEAESDSLWDELSHQQSREIQQHHHKIQHQNHNQNQFPNATSLPPLPNSARTGPWNVDSDKIKHTFQETAAKVASVAKTAAQSAQQRVHSAIESNWESDNHSEGSNSYVGPYAKYTNRTGHRHGGTYSSNDIQSPFEDFGLRESLEGLDGLHLGYANGESHHTAASKPLLENNYGMDAELGIGHMDGDNGQGHSSSGQTRSATLNSNGSSSNNPNRDRKFVLLETFGVRKDGWGTVANLDLFFTSLYNYYYHRGLVPIIGKGVVELISLFFTLWLSVFLFVYLDWYGLWECRDEESCRANLGAYIIDKPLTTVSFWNFLMMLYILLFSAYGIFSVSTFITNIKDAFEARYIFKDKLGISERKLEGGAVEWHEIVKKILELQQSGEYRIAIHGQDIKDELVVAQRILRRENFMIAFFNNDIFDLTIPLKIPWKGDVNANARSRTKFYSKSLEWSIYFCVLSYMFNHKYQIRPTFCMDAVSLQRRFIFCGVVSFLFMPFLLLFTMMHFSFQNVYDFRSSKQYLGPREWSNVAKWTFREFNELPHVFERRLEPSYEAAEDYLKLFTPSSLLNSIGRILVFLSGSLGAVCVALAAVNDAILLHVKIGNWNLLWYVGMLGVAYSIGKSMLPDNTVVPKYHHNLFAEMDVALMKVSNHTHYHPDFWKKRGWDNIIKEAFSELFQYKVKLFLLEIVSIIVAPIILCHSLPPRAIDICSFVQKAKMEVPGSGDHCGFATFDFELFEDENWEGQHSNEDNSTDGPVGGASIMSSNRSAFYSRFTSSQRPKAKMGKMEKSFFNFQTVHPGWKCASSGQDLVNRIKNYQNEQAVALARERQHHIAAAARQLDRLRELEEYNDVTGGPHLEQNQINEHYVKVDTDLQSGADIDPATIETPMDAVKEERNNLRVHFKDLPPTPPSTTRTMSKSNLSVLASVLRYDDIGLSAELNSLLNRSTFDPGASLLLPGESLPSLSFLGHPQQNSHLGEDETTREEVLQRQYMLLEKYHSQLNSQHEGSGSVDENIL